MAGESAEVMAILPDRVAGNLRCRWGLPARGNGCFAAIDNLHAGYLLGSDDAVRVRKHPDS